MTEFTQREEEFKSDKNTTKINFVFVTKSDKNHLEDVKKLNWWLDC